MRVGGGRLGRGSAIVAPGAWRCWTAEGAGVNYSITGWLSLELFKQAPASRGLGLITGCKSYAHDPFLDPALLSRAPLAVLGNIHMRGGWREGGM